MRPSKECRSHLFCYPLQSQTVKFIFQGIKVHETKVIFSITENPTDTDGSLNSETRWVLFPNMYVELLLGQNIYV